MLSIYIAVVVTLALGVAVADLIIDLRSVKPRRSAEVKRTAADEGIALAEQLSHARKNATGKPMAGDEKLRVAADWVTARCQEHRVKVTAAEIRKLLEIRLASAKDDKPDDDGPAA